MSLPGSMFQKHLELVCGKSLEKFGEVNKQKSRMLSVTKGYTDKVSGGNVRFLGNYNRGYPCYILAKK